MKDALRESDIDEATDAVAYLTRQAEVNSITDLDNVFFDLIKNQMQTITLANIRDEYVWITLDPAVVPSRPVFPNHFLMTILGFFLGGALGCLSAIIRGVKTSLTTDVAEV